MIAPQFAQPYVARGKNDAADAAAPCEAASRPQMRFVPAKTADQQAALMLAGQRERRVAPAHATREHDPRSWGRVWLRRRPALDGDPRRRPADRLAPGDEDAGPASPREHSTAGKARPGRITWAGDPMLRILLVVGAAAVIWQTRRGAANNPSGWLTALLERKAPKLAAVALANKMARIAGKLMASGERYAGASRAIAAA